ncbi:DedA family protein [Streptomyces wuyuanensis]|uniref:Membrane-associated protein n=1 Tax=Streptomyces wuyuanensis TaxID=1196353 RepID=A0A1H0DNG2_9ACTN|nr:DedA family protein [Streptomyces wuyuanensis]SDN71593.1 membrane-associated protein [Streptomyces wuyuanensis]
MHLNGVIEAAGWWSYAVMFLLTAAETSAFIGLLVPGEAVVLLASAIAGRGELNVFLLAAVVVTGAVTGDSLGYALGRRCARGHRERRRTYNAGTRQRRWRGSNATTGQARRRSSHATTDQGRRRSSNALTGHGTGRARAFLTHHGAAAVFTSKFIGFARTFVPYAAGASGMPYRRFLRWSAAASLVWGCGTVALGYFAGAAAIEFLHSAGLVGALALSAVTVPALIVVKVRARRRRHRPPTSSAVVASGGPRRPSVRRALHDFTHAQEK